MVATAIVIVVTSLLTTPSDGEVPTGFVPTLRRDIDEAIAPTVRRTAVGVLAIGVAMFIGFVVVFDVIGSA